MFNNTSNPPLNRYRFCKEKPLGAERKAVIDFEKGVGEKTLLLSFAKLMVVS